MLYFPPAPTAPTAPPAPTSSGAALEGDAADRHERTEAFVPVRYEDIAQDGRFVLSFLSNALGESFWKPRLEGHPASVAMREQGVVPILTRLVLEGGDGPFHPSVRPLAVATATLAHTVDEAGAVDRILLHAFCEASAPHGVAYGPPPDGTAPRVPVGRLFAEHVFTRLFAPPDQRRVTRLAFDGVPAVPPNRVRFRPLDAALALPGGAEALDDALRPDSAPIAFGLAHTDSNQHVNSLVYPRLFEEAALRRFASLGDARPRLARYAELGFRKPFFAGEKARIHLQAFRFEGRLGAVGSFVPEAGDDAKALEVVRPHAYACMVFDA
jgi:hypothetical protein